MPDRDLSTRIGADGTAALVFTPTKNVPWNVTQVSIEYRNAPSGCVAELRKNNALVTVMIATDVADREPPVFLRPGDRLVASWTGGTSGDTVSALFFYEETEYA